MFKKATKRQAKLRITFDGPAGSGKTYSALVLAKALGGKVGVIDTEHGSASKYANLFDFDTVELEEFSIETYIKTITAARHHYDVLIIDSLTHAWTGKGGALEQVDRGGKDKFTSGWKTVTPLQTQLVDVMVAFPGHVIATMRTKMEYVIEEVQGKKVPRKVGMAPIQREGMEYEFDVIADLDLEGKVTIIKTRCPDLSGSAGLLKHSDVAKLGETLKAWLSDGAAPEVAPPPAPPPAAAPASQPLPPTPNSGPRPPAQAAPVSPIETVEVAVAKAQSRADLDRVLPRIHQLPRPEQDRLRPIFMRRLKEVTHAAQR